MGTKGVIFDIKQMAVFDGPGIRTTVFFKGCPLRCQWCHNPEGLSIKKELMVSPNGCLKCGKCKEACIHTEGCVVCGDCIRACPLHLRKICGIEYEAGELAKKLMRDKAFLEANGGGITISGGEPTMQPEFLMELLEELNGMHRAIETCGYCDETVFREILIHLDYVMMDIKHTDPKQHQHYTGKSNDKILANLKVLKESGKPFVIRVPLIPGINDSRENMEATAKLLTDAAALERVELLPYHQTAGAKYGMVGRKYQPEFDPETAVHSYPEIFLEHGINCKVF